MANTTTTVTNDEHGIEESVRANFREWDARAASALHADVEDEQSFSAALSASEPDASTRLAGASHLDGVAAGLLAADHLERSDMTLRKFEDKLTHLDPARFPVPNRDWTVKLPKPKDQSFWWAETTLIEEPARAFSAAFRNGGLPSFIGGVYARENAMWAQFGATARFALSPDRRPKEGLYLSVPHVAINGGMSVSTFEGHWYAKDSMAFGGLTLSQEVFQFGMAQPDGGGNRISIARSETVDSNWKFNYKNIGGSRKFAMPGFRTFPPVRIDFGDLAVGDDLWVELTIRIDIRVRYGGSAYVTPLSTIEFSQWKANPL